jgi:hypothetical protein
MTQDHPEQLTEDELAIFRVDALLDAIIDGRPWTVDDELRFLLAGPFSVDWRTGLPPTEAPPTTWEPTVLELGHVVTEALHLDPCGLTTPPTTPEEAGTRRTTTTDQPAAPRARGGQHGRHPRHYHRQPD